MQRSVWVRLGASSVLAGATLCLVACGGDGDGGVGPGEALFDPADADAAAHAALPSPADMPGDGWEVTARDDFGDDDIDDFDACFEEEEACNELAGLRELGGIFSGDADDEDSWVGRAQVELSRALDDDELPGSVDVEIEVYETVTETRSGWSIARGLIESGEFGECMEAVISQGFEDDPEVEGIDLELRVRDRATLAESPHGGAAFGMEMEVSFAGIAFDAIQEIHWWPYSNAQVAVVISGPRDTTPREYVEDILERVDDAIVHATE